ncbi:MAG: single-stranded-DNA-specific exonuclease RecJ [Phycisphaerales bacterium]|nr:single-stranded-DNA-specific exonuclease RecJ [Phycisphaerales bacterium]
MSKRWIIEPAWEERDAAAKLWGVPPLVAQLLHNRGVRDVEAAQRFLCPSLKGLHAPGLLPGAMRAAEIIADAAAAGRRIVLYGDYDVDGITGVAILWRLLTAARANVGFYVPSRLDEGYGLHADAVCALADEGAELIVTVDCGVTGVEAAERLRTRGVPLVITDHHEPGATLPFAEAIVHPGMSAAPYPNPHLSGSGVAFKLAWAVAQRLSGAERVTPELRETLMDCLPLAALGTIADVVPLVDENRILARHGLAMLPDTRHAGLAALLESAGLKDSTVGGFDVGFKLAPRLNAAGRMGHARLAVELLTRATMDRAREIARVLEGENRTRQTVERQVFHQACERIDAERMAADSRHAIVVEGEGWHAGVIGIVAARVVDRYHRPAFLIALDGDRGQGSGRSVAAFDLNEALTACGEHLLSYGGHAMAAGLKIQADRVGAFREAFVQTANQRLTPTELQPRLALDGVIALQELTRATVDAIDAMEPFGQGNPKPRFATDWIELAAEPRAVGQDGTHLQAVFRQNGAQIKAIGFGLAGHLEDLKQHRRCRAAVEPMISRFNGRESVEMRLLDLQFE